MLRLALRIFSVHTWHKGLFPTLRNICFHDTIRKNVCLDTPLRPKQKKFSFRVMSQKMIGMVGANVGEKKK